MIKIGLALRRFAFDLDRFDLLIAVVIVGLLVAIAGVVLAGDRVGVYVVEGGFGPRGSAGGADPIRIRFSEAMSQSSVAEHFRIEPAIEGDLDWISRDTLIFTPHRPYSGGETYTVTIEQGARGAKREAALLDDLTWSFTVRPPRAAYLGPSDRFARNLFMTDLETGMVYQLTQSENGIEDFAVSPAGNVIAYTQYNADGASNLWLLHLVNQTSRPITNCVDARCFGPAWNADGSLLAYNREEDNSSLDSGLRASRVWIVDVKTLRTRLLFEDAQRLGFSPSWSPDGQRIALVDVSIPGIRIHDFTTNADTIIESIQGVTGWWTPDGQRLIYPLLVRGQLGQQFYTHLEMADFASLKRSQISGPEDAPVEDSEAAMSPGGQQLAVTRRYLNEQYTNGRQIYLLDLGSGEAQPLVVDTSYNHAAISWDAAGQRIVFQRFSLTQAGALPEIAYYNQATGEVRLVATNAMLPQWVP